MMDRRFSYRAALIAATLMLAAHSPARAVVIPFTETFDTDAANWLDNSGFTIVDHATEDGNGFITDTFDFTGFAAGEQSPVLFRANGANNPSGGAFVGDWITDGVATFSFDVRHDFDSPLTFFARFAAPTNFPGAIAVAFTPVAADTWTTLTIAIDPSNPEYVSFEGQTFESIFSNIGRVQIGANVDENLAGQTATFDVDNVNVAVPETTSLAVLIAGGSLVGLRRRRGGRIRSA